MKAIYKLVSVSVVAVVLTAGIFSLLMDKSLSEKQEEIVGLKEKVSVLRGELAGKENRISSLEGEIDNTQKFWRLLLKTVNWSLIEAYRNMSIGDSDYDVFLSYYEKGSYKDAGYFADRVDLYHGYAMTGFIEAKEGFLATKKYAPDERTLRLAENYIDLCEYGIDMASEMHQAGEYFSTACSYYAKGQWSQGDGAVEEANKHIKAQEALVKPFNVCYINITSLLEE